MDELLAFIQTARFAGASDEQITAILSEKGWLADQIQASFAQLKAPVAVSSSAIPHLEIPAIPEMPSVEPIPTIQENSYIQEAPPIQEQPIIQEPQVPDISRYAVPSSQIIPDQGYIAPSTPALPDLVIPTKTKDVVPGYVNESAMVTPKEKHPKTTIAAICIVLLLGVGGFAYWKGLLPTNFFKRTQVATSVFAQYEPLKRNTAILLTDSVRFTITGSQVMSSDDFNALQEDSDGVRATADNDVLLVYYTVQNMSDTPQVLATTEGDSQTFSVVDSNQKRVDIASGIFSDSLTSLADLKPRQYTSNAILFEVPKATDVHTLFFMLQSSDARPAKGYLVL